MKFYLIFAIFQLLSVNLSEQQQIKQNLSYELNCNHDLIPGMDRMVKGIDINTLNFYPMVESSMNGYMESIFSFSCANELTWINHNDEKNTVFSKPDEVENLSYLPEGQKDAGVQILKSLKELKSFLSGKAGVSGIFEDFGFTGSGSYQNGIEAFYQSEKIIALVRIFFKQIFKHK